ncbi:MAG: DNA alkylation repair protein [Prevotella sp.]|nr:DNA alkylation repair protein [Prevotella sp.]
MNNNDIQQQVKDIKQSFRQMMDGQVAQSMRQKGVDYHLNWGATLPRLKEMAEEIKAHPQSLQKGEEFEYSSGWTYSLAIALWKENIRECKILATMLMPPDELLPEVADIWMEQTETVEMAEQLAFNLMQHVPYAAEKAFLWISSADDLPQICGYHILSRLFMSKQEPNERGINEFMDQALAALQSPTPSLNKAAMQSIIHFADMGLVYERIARSAIHSIGLDFI